MNLIRISPSVPAALIAVVLSTACMPDASRRDRVDEAFLRIVAAEDARPTKRGRRPRSGASGRVVGTVNDESLGGLAQRDVAQ